MFTFRVLGILFGVMIIIAACFITEPPEGWMPTGWTPPAVKNSSGASAEGKNWKLMLADTRFYLMIIAFTIFATGGLMVVSQGISMAQAIGGWTRQWRQPRSVSLVWPIREAGCSGDGFPIKWGGIRL